MVEELGQKAHPANKAGGGKATKPKPSKIPNAGLKKPATNWAAIRHAYETSPETVADICVHYGVTVSALQWQRKHHHWPRRNGSVALQRPDLIARLFRVFEQKLDELEGQMGQTGEKEVQLLGNLARTLEKLIELDTREAIPKSNEHRPSDMADLRKKLTQRIGQLEGRKGP